MILKGAQHGDITAIKSLLPCPYTFIYNQDYIKIGDIMTKVRRICKQCGIEFRAFRSEIRKGGGIFCSRKCYEIWMKGENNQNWQGGGLEFTCKSCGRKFRLAKNELNRQKGYFCSRECNFKNRARTKMSRSQRRISRNMHGNVRKFLKDGKLGRKWQNLVGYSLDDLCKHLEEDFREGMTWKNYGEWHIDHVIPLSKFRFESFEDADFKKAWALNNLQPLWADENMKKGRRWRWY